MLGVIEENFLPGKTDTGFHGFFEISLKFEEFGAKFVQFMTRLIELAFYTHRIAKCWILFVNALHFHEAISRGCFLLYLGLNLVESLLQPFSSLIGW